MKVLVKTKDLSREEWLNWRTKGIGGSDVSIIAGINKFKSIYQLWKEKTGEAAPSETESDFAHFGTLLEPVVKAEFMKRTGLKVRAKHMILQSSEYPFMLADLDGVVNDNGKMCIFEAKTASAYKQDIWEKGVPLAYIMQVQHYMAVTGAEKTHIAAIVGGNRFFHYMVDRDEKMIKDIIEMEKRFWEENVLSGIEPIPDGSEATTAYLNETYASSNGNTVQLPQEALSFFEEYDEISKQISELNTSKEAICNRLKAYLKENENGIVGERRISWKEVQTNRFDQKKLAAEHPDLYQNYLKGSSYRRLTVA